MLRMSLVGGILMKWLVGITAYAKSNYKIRRTSLGAEGGNVENSSNYATSLGLNSGLISRVAIKSRDE